MSVYDDLLAADAGSAKPAANPYLDALQADEDRRQQAMAGTLTTATKVNPEQYNAARKVAGYLGYPTAAVEAMPSLADQAKVQQIRQDTAGAPVLQQRYTDADFAKLAHDDSNSLTAIESAIRMLGGAAKFVTSAPDAPWGGLVGAGRAVASGVPSASAGLYGIAASAFGLADQALQGIDNAAAFVTGTKRRQIVGTPGPEGFLRYLAEGASADATAVLGLPADAGFFERGVKSGLQSAGQNLAMLPVGLAETGAISGEAAVLGLMGLITGGQSYTKGRDAGLSPLAASAFAAQDATAEIVTEKYLGMAGFLKNVKAGASAGRLAMFELSKEVPGEIAATLWQNFNEWANLNPQKSVGDFIAEQPEAIGQTIIATLVGGGVQIGAVRGMQRLAGDSARKQAQAQEAEQFAQQAEMLGKLAEASKLRGRDAETFKQFVAQVADQEGEAPTEFFIDGQTLQNSLNQSGVSKEELAAIAPVVAAQLERARTGDVRVPVAEFMAAGEGVTAPLVDHLRASPEAMTRAEAQDFLKAHSDSIKSDVEQALQQHDQSAAFRESIAGVQAQFQAQLDAAQRFTPDVNKAYASLLANFYGTQAQRLGITPDEFAQRYGLKVQAQGAAGGRTMEQAPLTAEALKTEAERIKAKHGLQALDVSIGTGGDISLDMIAAGKRGEGAGTAAMQELIAFADKTGRRITLSPAQKGDPNGTTSRSRLVAFYKRFGFKENKGRAKDFTTTAGMIREAKGKTLNQSPLLPAADAVAAWKRSLEGAVKNPQVRAAHMPTPSVLRAMGVKQARLELPTLYLRQIQNDHPDIPAAVLTNLPALLADPLYVLPHKDGGINVVIDAVTAAGSPIIVGVRDGRIRTVTPNDARGDLSAAQRLERNVRDALSRPGKVYARKSEAPAVAGASDGAPSGPIPLRRDSRDRASLITAESLRKQGGTLDQPAESTPRAQISLPAGFDAGPAIISLLAGADLSSFIHESGHLFLEVQSDLAVRIQQQIDSGAGVTDLERGIVDDMNRLLGWFGVKGSEQQSALDEWAGMTLDEKRAHHEQFARGFEAYTMEGQAPSIALQSVFSRFRSWLLQVYQTLRGLNATLTDDVRAMMGRMLATDFAIEEAEAQRSMGPLFKDAETAGMTLQEFNAYQALAAHATDAATQALQERGMKDMKWLSRARDKALKARQAEVEAQRRDVRAEVRAEIYSEPVYRAWQFLTGKGAADETAVGGKARAAKGLDVTTDSLLVAIAKLGGINRESARRDVGLAVDDEKIKSGVFGMPVFRKEGGLTADHMREALTENGYLTAFDKFGRTDLRELADAIADEIGGTPRYSVSYDYAQAMGSQVEALPPEMRYGKLNTEALRQQYGTAENAIWRKLSAMRMTSDGGIDSDIVAETFGFESGDALVKALTEATPPREAIEARTDQRMLEMFGDITSPEALARAADEAVHNQARARFIASELKALQAANKVRSEGKNSLYGRSSVDVMAKAAETYARQIVARLKVSDIRPAQYAAAEARSAKLAEKALAAGKLDEAALHKRNQLVNNYATKAAYEALADIKAAQEFFRKVNSGNSDTIAKNRDFATVNVARAILAEYGLGTKGKSAGEYLTAVQANDPDLFTVLNERVQVMAAAAQPFKDMPVENLRGLHDEIRSLWQMAKRSRQIEIDGVMVDKARATLAVRERLEAIGIPGRMPGEGMAVTEAERRVTRLRTLWAALRRVESWVDLKDGGTPGPFRRYVWQPVRDAADAYRVDKAKYLKQYRALLEGLDLGRSRIDAPELGYVFGASRGGSGKQEILHAILHTGNESNKRKLLLGRKWAMQNEDGTLDTSRWDRFVQRMIDQGVLGKAEFDFAQGVWDLLESTKPLAQKAHRDVFGRYFDEVTADAFTTPFGTYRGGYVPALADPEVVTDAKTRAFIEAESQTLAHAFPSTAKGFTKARVEYNRALLLDLRSLAQHIDKVLLFSHLEQPIRDVRKVLADKEVAEPLHRVDPTAFDSLLTPWLNRAARQSVEQPVPGDNGLMRFWSKARSRAGLAAMFANVSNAAQQITGLSIAAVKVKPRHLLAASAQWISSPRKTAQAVATASPFMATRMDNEVAQMTDAINDILLNPSTYERTQSWTAKHAYFMQSAVDNVIGPIVWQGAYNQALEAGENERDAVRLADAAVRQTQGSTLPEDVARFEGGNSFVRMFTQFAGYFNMQANLLGTEFANGMRNLGLRRGMGRGLYVFTLGFLVPALVSELIVQAFRGGPDDDDKDGEYLDDWLAALGMGTLRSGLAMVPVVGQVTNAAINTFNTKPYDDRISTAPAVSMIESAVSAPHSVYKAVTEDGSARKAVRDVATFITMTTGLPATAVARPVGYMADVAQGRVQPTSGADMARGLVTGTASPESKR